MLFLVWPTIIQELWQQNAKKGVCCPDNLYIYGNFLAYWICWYHSPLTVSMAWLHPPPTHTYILSSQVPPYHGVWGHVRLQRGAILQGEAQAGAVLPPPTLPAGRAGEEAHLSPAWGQCRDRFRLAISKLYCCCGHKDTMQCALHLIGNLFSGYCYV